MPNRVSTRAAVLTACVSLPLAACGKSVILERPTEQLVSDAVYHHTGFRPTDVRCPSGVSARVGGRFQCHFSGPDGPYTAYMRITSVHGQHVTYDIQSHRNGQTILPGPSERLVAGFVFNHTGFRPKDVRCPSGVQALVGATFQCQFTGPDGHYTAYVQITSVNGQRTTDRIQTRRTS